MQVRAGNESGTSDEVSDLASTKQFLTITILNRGRVRIEWTDVRGVRGSFGGDNYEWRISQGATIPSSVQWVSLSTNINGIQARRISTGSTYAYEIRNLMGNHQYAISVRAPDSSNNILVEETRTFTTLSLIHI